MIIVEGMDNSGKSTLASFLATALGYPIQASEGPPKYEGEMETRLARYAELPHDTIFDRHPIVSQSLYGSMRGKVGFNVETWWAWLDGRKPFIIYCDPLNRGLNGHKRNAVDTDDHIAQIDKNYDFMINGYRRWAVNHAHLIYRIGDDMNRVLHAVRPTPPDMFGDIIDFHEKYQLEYDGPPRALSHDLSIFRTKFMLEELFEYLGFPEDEIAEIGEAVRTHFTDRGTPPLEHQFDALVDLVYVALGTAYLHGFDFREGWRRVQDANMRKVRALRPGDSKRGSTYDVVKPPGFVPPDLSDLVR